MYLKNKKCTRCNKEYLSRSHNSLYCGSKVKKEGCAYLVRIEINRRSFKKHYNNDSKLYLKKRKESKIKKYGIKPKVIRKGFILSYETKKKISETRKSRKIIAYNKKPDTFCEICGVKVSRHSYKKCIYCYRKVAGKINKGIKKSDSHRINLSIAKKGKFLGEKSPGWKGGINKKNNFARKSVEITLWKEKCLKRDKYTCQKYGTKGGNLNVHHIKNFSEYPELRTDISNGITLSKKAHDLFHKIYGKKNNTKEQIEEFINKKI